MLIQKKGNAIFINLSDMKLNLNWGGTVGYKSLFQVSLQLSNIAFNTMRKFCALLES